MMLMQTQLIIYFNTISIFNKKDSYDCFWCENVALVMDRETLIITWL